MSVVSRLAVPLPTATASMLYWAAILAKWRAAFSALPLGGNGNTTSWNSKLPCLSSTTTLHPVLIPGSTPITDFCPNGAASNSCRRLVVNTSIASSSAFSLLRAENSFSILGTSRRLYESSTASATSCEHLPLPRIYCRFNLSVARSPSIDIFMRNIPSASPRRIANSLLPVQRDNGSAKSK